MMETDGFSIVSGTTEGSSPLLFTLSQYFIKNDPNKFSKALPRDSTSPIIPVVNNDESNKVRKMCSDVAVTDPDLWKETTTIINKDVKNLKGEKMKLNCYDNVLAANQIKMHDNQVSNLNAHEICSFENIPEGPENKLGVLFTQFEGSQDLFESQNISDDRYNNTPPQLPTALKKSLQNFTSEISSLPSQTQNYVTCSISQSPSQIADNIKNMKCLQTKIDVLNNGDEDDGCSIMTCSTVPPAPHKQNSTEYIKSGIQHRVSKEEKISKINNPKFETVNSRVSENSSQDSQIIVELNTSSHQSQIIKTIKVQDKSVSTVSEARPMSHCQYKKQESREGITFELLHTFRKESSETNIKADEQKKIGNDLKDGTSNKFVKEITVISTESSGEVLCSSGEKKELTLTSQNAVHSQILDVSSSIQLSHKVSDGKKCQKYLSKTVAHEREIESLARLITLYDKLLEKMEKKNIINGIIPQLDKFQTITDKFVKSQEEEKRRLSSWGWGEGNNSRSQTTEHELRVKQLGDRQALLQVALGKNKRLTERLRSCHVDHHTRRALQENISLRPENVSLQPEYVSLQPENVSLQHESVSLQPKNISLQPENVSLQHESVSLQPKNISLQPENVLLLHEKGSLSSEDRSLTFENVPLIYGKKSQPQEKSFDLQINKMADPSRESQSTVTVELIPSTSSVLPSINTLTPNGLLRDKALCSPTGEVIPPDALGDVSGLQSSTSDADYHPDATNGSRALLKRKNSLHHGSIPETAFDLCNLENVDMMKSYGDKDRLTSQHTVLSQEVKDNLEPHTQGQSSTETTVLSQPPTQGQSSVWLSKRLGTSVTIGSQCGGSKKKRFDEPVTLEFKIGVSDTEQRMMTIPDQLAGFQNSVGAEVGPAIAAQQVVGTKVLGLCPNDHSYFCTTSVEEVDEQLPSKGMRNQTIETQSLQVKFGNNWTVHCHGAKDEVVGFSCPTSRLGLVGSSCPTSQLGLVGSSVTKTDCNGAATCVIGRASLLTPGNFDTLNSHPEIINMCNDVALSTGNKMMNGPSGALLTRRCELSKVAASEDDDMLMAGDRIHVFTNKKSGLDQQPSLLHRPPSSLHRPPFPLQQPPSPLHRPPSPCSTVSSCLFPVSSKEIIRRIDSKYATRQSGVTNSSTQVTCPTGSSVSHLSLGNGGPGLTNSSTQVTFPTGSSVSYLSLGNGGLGPKLVNVTKIQTASKYELGTRDQTQSQGVSSQCITPDLDIERTEHSYPKFKEDWNMTNDKSTLTQAASSPHGTQKVHTTKTNVKKSNRARADPGRKRGRPKKSQVSSIFQCDQNKHSTQREIRKYFPIICSTSGEEANRIDQLTSEIAKTHDMKSGPIIGPSTNKPNVAAPHQLVYSGIRGDQPIDPVSVLKAIRSIQLIEDDEVTETTNDIPGDFWLQNFAEVRMSEMFWNNVDSW